MLGVASRVIVDVCSLLLLRVWLLAIGHFPVELHAEWELGSRIQWQLALRLLQRYSLAELLL